MKKLIITALLACMLLTGAADAATMYTQTGATIEVDDSQVEDMKSRGWFASYWDVVTKLYTADGRSMVMYDSDAPFYTSNGWYTDLAQKNEWQFVNNAAWELSVPADKFGNYYLGEPYYWADGKIWLRKLYILDENGDTTAYAECNVQNGIPVRNIYKYIY